MTTNDERPGTTAGPQENRPDALPGHYRESADPQDTGVITSGHPERVSEDDAPSGDDDPSQRAFAGDPLTDRPAPRHDATNGLTNGATGGMTHGATEGIVNGAAPGAVSGDGDWDRLAMDFVDDPRGAVAEAVRLVRDAVDRTTSASSDGDTEGLRTAFRRLRDLHRTLVTH